MFSYNFQNYIQNIAYIQIHFFKELPQRIIQINNTLRQLTRPNVDLLLKIVAPVNPCTCFFIARGGTNERTGIIGL